MIPVAAPNRRHLLTHPAGIIATGFGSGLSPLAPGTVGSLAALLPWWWLLRVLSPWNYALVIGLGLAIGVWASAWMIRRSGTDDPQNVVWDEFVGLWIALFLLPDGWAWVIAGFSLFRLFDIWKPWPVRWADRRLHGGFGVMLDDVLAGLYAFGVIQLLHTWIGS